MCCQLGNVAERELIIVNESFNCMFIIAGTFKMQRVQEIATPNMSVSSCAYKMRRRNLTRFCPRNLTSVSRVPSKLVRITL